MPINYEFYNPKTGKVVLKVHSAACFAMFHALVAQARELDASIWVRIRLDLQKGYKKCSPPLRLVYEDMFKKLFRYKLFGPRGGNSLVNIVKDPSDPTMITALEYDPRVPGYLLYASASIFRNADEYPNQGKLWQMISKLEKRHCVRIEPWFKFAAAQAFSLKGVNYFDPEPKLVAYPITGHQVIDGYLTPKALKSLIAQTREDYLKRAPGYVKHPQRVTGRDLFMTGEKLDSRHSRIMKSCLAKWITDTGALIKKKPSKRECESYTRIGLPIPMETFFDLNKLVKGYTPEVLS
jgi:hypothetical protein